jgi:NAD(P)-dependent dehydrogenase (short-subunit alcohol dehydrogenase family)
MPENQQRTCLIMGAGIGLGSGLARAFAAEGLTVCLARRSRNLAELEQLAKEIGDAGGKAHAFGVDARDEDEVTALVNRIEAGIGPLEVVIFNIGANVRFSIRDTTAQVFRKVWEMAAFGGFLTGREAARVMVPRGRGTIIFTGATASIRGSAGFAAFASAKQALRALAQSMARELGPDGVHVAHVVVDGLIDGKFARENFADAQDRLDRDEILRPDEIAQTYVNLWQQPRSAWTHELDLRPWTETF